MKKSCNIYLLFTIIFIIFITLGLLPSEIKTGYPLGFGLFTDAYKQHLVFMRDYVMNVKAFFGGTPLNIYRFDIGLGSDFFLSYGYYSLFDPLTLIAYLIPIKHIEFSYYLIAILRLYLSGVFLMLLAQELGIHKKQALLAAGLFYCFNITALYSTFRHPFFTNGPMILPLVILGAEKVIRARKPYLLIIASFLGLITQFYFYIYTTFGFVLYVFLRLFPKIKEESWKSFLKSFISICLVYALGAFLGGFSLVPQLLGAVLGGRISSKGFEFYNAYDLLNYLLSFFVPIVGSRYSSTIGNFYVFFIVLLYIFNYKKSLMKTYFLILASLLFIPFFGYAINMFSYINNRWTYLLILPASLMLGKILEGEEELKEEAIIKASRIFLLLLSLLTVLAVATFAEKSGNFLIIMILIVFIVLEIPAVRIILGSKIKTGIIKYFNPKVIYRFTFISSFLLLLGFGFACTFVLTVSEGLNGAYSEKSAFDVISEDDSFYRVDQNVYALNTDFLGNDNLVYGFPAPYSYNTMNNGYINDMIEFFNVVNHNNTVGYNGFNERTALNSINHVKYLLVRESEKISVPYGFSLLSEIKLEKFDEDRFNNYTGTGYIEYSGNEKVYETAYIYQNDNFLNFGFVYHEYARREDLEDISYLGRENVLLEAAILENDCNLPLYEPKVIEPLTPRELKPENIILEPGKIICGKGGGKISFSVDVEEAELYVEILGLKTSRPNQYYSVRYETDATSHEERYYAYGTNFYYPNFDHLLNMGYYENESLEVRIVFEEGEYAYDAINYYLNPVGDIEEKVGKLKSETLEDLEFGPAGFSGKITLDSPGLLFISLPYSSGFSAYVDGIPTKIEKVNIGYMGVLLDAGSHDIKFVYKTPGMKFGLMLSLFSLGIIAAIPIVKTLKRKKEVKVYDAMVQKLL